MNTQSNGQADDASESLSGLADFLGGIPDGAADEDDAEDQPEEGVGTNDDDPDESEEPDEGADDEKPEDPASIKKFKVTVKGDDGADVTEEVTEQELLAGYQRQKAFTQKTMELAEQSRQAAAVFEKNMAEGRNFYLQQALVAKNAISQVAGLRSEQELLQLSHTDPAAWVQERQRADAVHGMLAQLEQQMQQEQHQMAQQNQQRHAEAVGKAWAVLNEKGVTREQLADMYSKAEKAYGYRREEIHANVDARSVLMLKDALAYRALQEKKPQIANKVSTAEKLPASKKPLPANERANTALNARFSKGRAKVNDLAAFIANNRM